VPKSWKRFAVNEAIRGLGDKADYWVLSDEEIVHEYAGICPRSTTILAMNRSTRIIHRRCKDNKIYTVESTAKTKNYDNGFEFFSRGTVMIGAIEMARYMGINKFFVFGLDCFRLKNQYYYDKRKPISFTENNVTEHHRVRMALPPHVRIWVTPKLKKMILKLKETVDSRLWEDVEVWCVDSPYSQQTSIPKMTLEEFQERTKTRRKRVAKIAPVVEKPAVENPAPEAETISKQDWDKVVGDFANGCLRVMEGEGQMPGPIQALRNRLLSTNAMDVELYSDLKKALEIMALPEDDGTVD
jgi:hypothetical protein